MDWRKRSADRNIFRFRAEKHMRRVFPLSAACVALCLGYTSLNAAPPGDSSAPGWTKALMPLQEDGWEYVAATPTLVVYVAFRSVARKGSTATAAVRGEWMDPQENPPTRIGKFLSSISQVEFDCATGSLHHVSEEVYAGHNLTGESSSPDAPKMGEWATLFPESVAKQLSTATCSRTEGTQSASKASSPAQ